MGQGLLSETAIQRVAHRIARAVDAGEAAPRLDALAQDAGVSRFQLLREFRRVVGVTPKDYATARRMERFRGELTKGGSVTEAVYAAGFGSSSRAYEKTSREMGLKPSDYKRGGAAELIHYTTVRSPLGRMLVAATSRGVCSIRFGTNDAGLAAELRSEFVRAEIVRANDDAALAEAVAGILAQMSEHPRALALPLDLRATAFQQRVWRALMAIPRGETRSYGDVARSIRRPRAVRAVARAIATNPVAVVVPCHRVIGADGRLTGYRWGLERKAKLLRFEGVAAARG
jgi:AraC family transcriptional regulator of adaptative response/methylated-DNA-[protein]-cysteine methyltransferase